MGNNVKMQDMGYQIGAQTNRTSVAGTLIDFAPEADQFAIVGATEKITLNTDHYDAGVKYTDLASRNLGEVPLRTPLWPNIAGLLFNAVFARNSDGTLDYHTVRRWWRSAIGGTEDKGEEFRGVIFNSVSLSISRSQSNAAISFDAAGFFNAKRRLTDAETNPTPDLSEAFAYGTAGVLIDFVHDEDVDSYGADDQQVQSVSLAFSNNCTLDGVQDNIADPPLHRSWLTHITGNPTIEVNVTVRLNDDGYVRIDEFTEVPKGKLRLAFTHPRATTITSTSTISSGTTSTQVLNVSSTTGFSVGDIVCITHPTTGFTIAKITAISAGVSLTVSGYDSRVTLDGSTGGPLTIRNMSCGITIDSMDFESRSAPQRAGAFQVINLRYMATLKAGATFPLEALAYDHDNSRL